MIDECSRPDVRLAALQRERAAVESKPAKGDDAKETKARRLSEIDDALGELGARPESAPAGRQQKAVR